jgi:uncharacterized protein
MTGNHGVMRITVQTVWNMLFMAFMECDLSSMDFWFLAVVLFIAASLYSSVGHGGASAYLLVLSLWSVEAAVAKPMVLVLNIGVASVALISFVRAGHFSSGLFLPLALFSVPAAYVGGMMQVSSGVFAFVVAAALCVGAWCLWLPVKDDVTEDCARGRWMLPCLGLVIGFGSGLVGIGGGIFLTPLLLFMRLANARRAAAVSAAFIVVNSAAGWMGWLRRGEAMPQLTWYLLPAVLAGGWIGSRWGGWRAAMPVLRRVLSAVLLIAAAKFLIV